MGVQTGIVVSAFSKNTPLSANLSMLGLLPDVHRMSDAVQTMLIRYYKKYIWSVHDTIPICKNINELFFDKKVKIFFE